MSRGLQLQATQPVVTLNGVPASVGAFASRLIDERLLAAPVELDHVPLGESSSNMSVRQTLQPLSQLAGFEQWLGWVSDWARLFSLYSDASRVRMRLSHSRQPSCPKFHVDGVRLRCIAVLNGPGTEWLRAQDVRRLEDGSIAQNPDPALVQQIAPRSVAFFPGLYFDPTGNCGVVHRSPPDCVDRVVMTLDMAT